MCPQPKVPTYRTDTHLAEQGAGYPEHKRWESTFLIFDSHRDIAAIAASPRQIDALSLSYLLPITASLSLRSTGDGRSEGAFFIHLLTQQPA